MLITRLVAVAALALGLAACSSDGSDSPSGLRAAMDSVPGNDAGRADFQYGDLARMRELGMIDPTGEPAFDPGWLSVAGFGSGQLAQAALGLPDQLGLTLFAADTAVTIGRPPNTAVRIDGGVDRDKINDKLAGFGAEPRKFGDTEGLSLAGDNELNRDNPLVKLGIVNLLDQVAVTDDQFYASPNSPTLTALLDRGSSLLDTDGYDDLADCLGDVLAAEIFESADDDANAAVYAVGVRNPKNKTAPHDEVVCVLPRSGNTGTVKSALTKNMALSATDSRTNLQLSRFASKSQVAMSGDVVQDTLTMKPDARPGFVLTAVQTGQVRLWVG